MTTLLAQEYPTIADAGKSSEQEFCRLTGAYPIRNRRTNGDVFLNGQQVEVKRVGPGTGRVHQIRVWQYLPLAVHDIGRNQWLVLPPNAVARLVAREGKRGEQGENPFECSGLSLSECEPWRVADSADLYDATLDAILEGQRYPGLRDVLRRVVADTRRLADLHRSAVWQELEGC